MFFAAFCSLYVFCVCCEERVCVFLWEWSKEDGQINECYACIVNTVVAAVGGGGACVHSNFSSFPLPHSSSTRAYILCVRITVLAFSIRVCVWLFRYNNINSIVDSLQCIASRLCIDYFKGTEIALRNNSVFFILVCLPACLLEFQPASLLCYSLLALSSLPLPFSFNYCLSVFVGLLAKSCVNSITQFFCRADIHRV